MKKYIALVRGINVGGHKKIRMADLKLLIESLGFSEVQTYIQSGNVVFTSEMKTDPGKAISEAIEKKYGWEVPVLIKTAAEIEAILKECPFPEEKKKNSYFTLLHETPLAEDITRTQSFQFPKEEFHITPSCVYMYSEAGAAKAKLSNNFFESKLKVVATTRNFNTLNKLLIL